MVTKNEALAAFARRDADLKNREEKLPSRSSSSYSAEVAFERLDLSNQQIRNYAVQLLVQEPVLRVPDKKVFYQMSYDLKNAFYHVLALAQGQEEIESSFYDEENYSDEEKLMIQYLVERLQSSLVEMPVVTKNEALSALDRRMAELSSLSWRDEFMIKRCQTLRRLMEDEVLRVPDEWNRLAREDLECSVQHILILAQGQQITAPDDEAYSDNEMIALLYLMNQLKAQVQVR
jgi:hypothetical protein